MIHCSCTNQRKLLMSTSAAIVDETIVTIVGPQPTKYQAPQSTNMRLPVMTPRPVSSG